MKSIDIVKLAYRALFERKTRAILTILGIVVGPLIITTITASVQGLSQSAINLILRDVSPEAIFVTPLNGYLSSYTITQLSHLDGVVYVVPFYTIPVTIYTSKGEISTTILSVNIYDLQKVLPGISISSGTAPSAQSYNQVAIGYDLQNPPSPNQPSLHVGQEISVSVVLPNGGQKTETLLVTGGLSDFDIVLGTISINKALIMSYSIGEEIYGTKYSGAIVLASSLQDVSKVVSEIHQYLGSYVSVNSAQDVVSFINQQVVSFNLLLLIVSSASFIVAFISVLTTMITSVVERTREIGLLMSLGFERRQVMLMFLSEATIMGIIGGGIGTIGGYFSSYAFLDFLLSSPIFKGLHAEPIFTITQAVTLFLFIVLISTFAGLIPAYRASKIEPAKALRYEV
jgi:ABC-type transport system, involved in lipoprotein release, permease component